MKIYYNRKIHCTKLQIGDLVLVRQYAFKTKHKISDRWQNVPYEVIAQPDIDLPVFKVRQQGTELVKTLHRNYLLPLLTRLDDITNMTFDSHPVSDTHTSTSVVDSVPDHTGPVTRSRTCNAIINHANLLMEIYFSDI